MHFSRRGLLAFGDAAIGAGAADRGVDVGEEGVALAPSTPSLGEAGGGFR